MNVLGFGSLPSQFQLDPTPPALHWSAARTLKQQAGNMHKINCYGLVEGLSRAVEVCRKPWKQTSRNVFTFLTFQERWSRRTAPLPLVFYLIYVSLSSGWSL